MGVKGVIVAAGYGTRFLPVTRCVPKEMLPLVDRPAIDLVVEEFIGAGIEEILVISSRRKKAMEDWFDRDPELEELFRREGAERKLRQIEPPKVKVSFVRQQRMGGTGDALRLARSFAGSDPVVVAYPDDLFGPPNCSAQLIDTWRRTECSVLSAEDLGEVDVSRYGVLDVREVGGETMLRQIVEKPPVGTEPSKMVSWGRYLFTPDFFDALDAGAEAHTGGEYFHVGAINALAAAGRMAVRRIDSPRWDTGTPLGYLQACIEVAFQREDLAPALRAWLRGRLDR